MSTCTQPLIVHRVNTADGGWEHLRRTKIFECPDAECDANPTDHATELPCAWSWPVAHGKAYDGRSFPRRRCPGCYHVRRAGTPGLDLGRAG